MNIRFLSRQDIVGMGLSHKEVIPAIEQALAEHAAGTYEMPPKIGVHPTGTHPANFLHAMPGYLKGIGACGLKWVGGFARNGDRGLPSVTGIQIYNDTETGVPLAVMDCSHLTGLRTAAVSTVAALRLSVSRPRVLGLAGCGFQGGMHLEMLCAVFPSLETVRLMDVRTQSAYGLAERARRYFSGAIEVCTSGETCFRDADLIVTCTPGDDQVVSPSSFKAGAFGVGIEGGCAYTAAALHLADKFLVDDVPLANYFDELGRHRTKADGTPDPEFPGGMPTVYATLGEIVAGKKPGRQRQEERIVAIPIGMSICDIALTKLVYETALARNIGTELTLM